MPDGPAVGQPSPSYDRAGYADEPVGPARAANTQAVVAFVLGIFSVFGLWVLGPVAIVVANRALRKVESGEIPPSSRGLAVVGRVLGIIGTVLLVLAAVAFAVGLLLLVTRRSTTP